MLQMHSREKLPKLKLTSEWKQEREKDFDDTVRATNEIYQRIQKWKVSPRKGTTEWAKENNG